ncbi:NAD(P)/FAD-dependent oxidoreductase [Methylomonas sp. OY6]|uniref:NAD(P)/FAD-dependent oxidoreductase n=1 Tax=Methylomonas defluvii TaxID=3045149 RepID=A0ABU4ULL2_9GAMM|nr:NAD(P)/FAD-dependent oxidoreductase [Methylomonas sp. OY6]MDX8130305.1 NAD(P)/FAD-dependent oxidoreductase [Methylomonas sp. OY6]
MSQSERFDAAVIGGGPSGTSAAIILAKAGKHVVLFERSRFPRFQIGESLLPACWELWRRLGVTEKIEAEGFTVKQGANFGMFNQKPDVLLLTAEYPGYFERPYTYHVERARFDEILLEHAAECGVDVRREWAVADVLFDGKQAIGVSAGPNDADPAPIHASVVIDASGRESLIARKLNWRRPLPELNKIAHFAHFKGGFRRDPHGFINFGDVIDGSVTTDIHTIDGGWVWYIPLRDNIISVGAVLDTRFAKNLGDSPQQRFEAAIQSCECVREWLADAEQAMDIKSISSIGYMNERFHGDGFMLVGDASMFVDPVFSAGVTLAMRSGVYAADAALEGFANGDDFSAARFSHYEARIREPMGRIFQMIYNWYRILEQKDANNIILRSRQSPMLRERFIVLLSGGYDMVSMKQILEAGQEPSSTYLIS